MVNVVGNEDRWEDAEAHTIVVTEVVLPDPANPLGSGEIEFEVEHLPSCVRRERRECWQPGEYRVIAENGGPMRIEELVEGTENKPCGHCPACVGEIVVEYQCSVQRNLDDGDVAFILRYSGTPVTEPGMYQIKAWGSRTYFWDYAAYEYDGGLFLAGPPDVKQIR